MIKILTVIGARPQIIKAAALSRAIAGDFSHLIEESILHTGQHYDQKMSQVFFDELGIPESRYNLGIGSASHGEQTARMIEGIEKILLEDKFDYLLLYGDTNSTLAGAIAASKISVPIIHVEAGLRSFNRQMPEEVNRVVCDHLSTLLFSPTKAGFDNLIREGFDAKPTSSYSPDRPGIFHCGDIMLDNSLHFSKIAEEKSSIVEDNDLVKDEFVLATVHRDHNTDDERNLNAIFKALLKMASDYKVIVPLHPRTLKNLKLEAHKDLYLELSSCPNLIMVPPVSFLDIIRLEKNAKMVITDSGGVQKEAYFFNKPCIILRPETEWVEILETGHAILAGADYDKILEAYQSLGAKKAESFPEIFGDGKAGKFICEVIMENE